MGNTGGKKSDRAIIHTHTRVYIYYIIYGVCVCMFCGNRRECVIRVRKTPKVFPASTGATLGATPHPPPPHNHCACGGYMPSVCCVLLLRGERQSLMHYGFVCATHRYDSCRSPVEYIYIRTTVKPFDVQACYCNAYICG